MESSQPLNPEDSSCGNTQSHTNTAGKKKRRRRKKHKAEHRKEEQGTAAELELCELSSDEEQSPLNGR